MSERKGKEHAILRKRLKFKMFPRKCCCCQHQCYPSISHLHNHHNLWLIATLIWNTCNMQVQTHLHWDSKLGKLACVQDAAIISPSLMIWWWDMLSIEHFITSKYSITYYHAKQCCLESSGESPSTIQSSDRWQHVSSNVSFSQRDDFKGVWQSTGVVCTWVHFLWSQIQRTKISI